MMPNFKSIATAANFNDIKAEVAKYFHHPKKLEKQSPGLWLVCNFDGSPFGYVNRYYVACQGTRYQFFLREILDDDIPIIHRPEAARGHATH